MKFLPLVVISAILGLTACVGVHPSMEEIQAADYGAKPTNPNPLIVAYFEDVLKDPESARYDFGEPVRGYYGKTLSNLAGPRDIRYGWLVPTEVNAKNSFGGYTGAQAFHCWFRGDELVSVVELATLYGDVQASTPVSFASE